MLRLFCQKYCRPASTGEATRNLRAGTPDFPHYSRLIPNIQDGGRAPPAGRGGRIYAELTRRSLARNPGLLRRFPPAREHGNRRNPGTQPMSYLPYPRAGILGILRGIAEPRLVFQKAAAGAVEPGTGWRPGFPPRLAPFQ